MRTPGLTVGIRPAFLALPGTTAAIAPSGGSGAPTVISGSVSATDNLTQVGGNPVVTGTGPSGAGVPRVTVSSDSTVAIAGGNLAQETGGNLAQLVALQQLMGQLVHTQTLILATLEAIRLQAASAYGASVEPSQLALDPTVN